MKKLLLFSFILVSIFSCSKKSEIGSAENSPGIISDILKDKYSDHIPEVKQFNHLNETLNSSENYIILVGTAGRKILVVYLDKINKKTAFKAIFEVSNKIKAPFFISEFKTTATLKKNDAVQIILHDGAILSDKENLKDLGTMIIYPNAKELRNIEIAYSNGLKEEPSSIDFTFKTISFFKSDSLFMYNRDKAENILASRDIGSAIMVHPLTNMFLEGNKMVWVEFSPNKKNKCIIKCYPISNSESTYREIWSRIIPLIEFKDTDIVTNQFILSDDENDIILTHKAFGKKEDASSGTVKDFSEEYIYRYQKNTGK